MKVTPIPINLIHITSNSQSRATTDRRTVEEYAIAWRSDAEFPPVDLFRCDNAYFPGDGIHRILAARLAGRTAILAYVYRGDERDAFLHACASNQAHGLRRTNRDKRHMVTRILGDKEWVKWSDRRIADQCGVSSQFVANVRQELSTVVGSPASRHAKSPRIGADGKVRKRPVKNGNRFASHGLASLSLVRDQTNGLSPKRSEMGDHYSARHREALILIEKLRKVLVDLELYECCSNELHAIGERVQTLALSEKIA